MEPLVSHLSEIEILPGRERVDKDDPRNYPNALTLHSINREIIDRIAEGFTPIQAFLTVADGVRNWSAHEVAE